MGTLNIPNTFTTGTTIDAAQMNANFTAVKNFAEGLSTGAQFDAGAVNTEDIANSAITAAKIATGAVTSTKIPAGIALTTPSLGAATATSINATGNIISHVVPNPIVGAYTLALTDDGTIIEKNDVSGVAVTIPADSTVNFPVGTQIVIIQTGAGQTSIAGSGGVTINATPGFKLRAQWSAAVLLKRAANTWVALGDLAV
jgi:hypothetical protein